MVLWSSKIPVTYKRNGITGELHRAKQIVSDCNRESKRIRQKHRNTGFLLKFVNELICNFERGKEWRNIPEWLFDERKNFSIRFPYSPVNKKFSEVFMIIVQNFSNDKVKMMIIWITPNIQSIFNNKDKVKHHTCLIYHGFELLFYFWTDDWSKVISLGFYSLDFQWYFRGCSYHSFYCCILLLSFSKVVCYDHSRRTYWLKIFLLL